MRSGIVGSLLAAFASASLALAQSPYASPYNALPARSAPTGNVLPANMSPANALPVNIAPAEVKLEADDTPITPPPSRVVDGHGNTGNDVACPVAGNICGPAGCIWISAEYLSWWIKDSRLPPLVTRGVADPTLNPPPGALGATGTSVLFGGGNLDNEEFAGGRLTFGGWLNCAHTFGVEGSAFFLGSRSNNFGASTTGAPGAVLARPFFDVSTGLPNAELISFPGLATGSIGVHSSSRLQGGEFNLLCNLCCSCPDTCDTCGLGHGYRVDFITGVRYLQLREGLGTAESLQVSPFSPVFTGDNLTAFDQFDTRNQFYGGQVGLRAEVWQGRFFANVTGKVALGETHQTVDINGATTINPPVGTATFLPGGLLAQPSNIGHYSRERFSVVPEVGVNVGYQVTQNLRLFVGYTLLYWTNVARPGDAINTGVNSTRTPLSLVPGSGPIGPSFIFRDSDFWASGVNVGVQLRW